MTNNNFTDGKVNNDIVYSPVINPDNTCLTDNNVIIYNCTIDDKGNITGFTDSNVKALYRSDCNKWFFGSEIGYSNLIPLTNNKEKARELGRIGGKKAKENRDQKKNIQELAKSMLELTMTEDQIKSIMGDDSGNMLIDNSVASVMLGAMIKSALSGSFKAFEAVRDTAGYKPKNEVELQADIMTEADKSLIDKALKTG